jgi:hypothetical protein
MMVILAIYFIADYRFYPHITIGDIIKRTLALGPIFIILFGAWYLVVNVATYLIIKNVLS